MLALKGKFGKHVPSTFFRQQFTKLLAVYVERNHPKSGLLISFLSCSSPITNIRQLLCILCLSSATCIWFFRLPSISPSENSLWCCSTVHMVYKVSGSKLYLIPHPFCSCTFPKIRCNTYISNSRTNSSSLLDIVQI